VAVSGTLRSSSTIVMILALLVGVSLLPPDTSLQEVKTASALKACVPLLYPPLVTNDPDLPGIDIELLRAIAEKMGVSLLLSENAAMGRDFNPRNWNLNRAQCQVIAGGVVDSEQTRSFLETGPAYSETGWAVLSRTPVDSLLGLNVGTLALASGLDRIALSSYLRSQKIAATVVTNPEALVAGLENGSLDAGITEALLASRLAAQNNWSVSWAPSELDRYNLVFGLWKGDITLKRAIEAAFAELAEDGSLAAILARYSVAPID